MRDYVHEKSIRQISYTKTPFGNCYARSGRRAGVYLINFPVMVRERGRFTLKGREIRIVKIPHMKGKFKWGNKLSTTLEGFVYILFEPDLS